MHSADQSGPRITAGPSHGVEVYFRRTRQVRHIRLERGDHSRQFVDLLCRIGLGVHNRPNPWKASRRSLESVLRDAPELGDKPQLRDLLLQRDGHIVTGLQIDQPDESALKLARVRAPVKVGLGFDQNVDQVRHL
jgi:hypothetical protein